VVRLAPLVGVVALTACGRVAFDARGDAGDNADDDAPSDGVPSALIHQYSFNGNFNDDLGGPALTPLGGVFVAGGYQFAINQGLTLLNAVPVSAYTVDVQFQLDQVTGYNKILDFKNLAADEGCYVMDSQLQFVIVAVTGCPGMDCATSAAGLFAIATNVQVTLTRDVSNRVVGYVNRTPAVAFDDTMTQGTFDGPNAAVHFFVDDNVTTNEATSGVVRRIRIYDRALTAGELTP